MSQTQFGQVPKHWKVMPLEKCAFVQTGAAKGRKLGDSNTVTLPYLRVANVQDGHLDLTEIKTIRIRESEIERYRLQLGDVVLTEGGDFDKLGRGFIWQEQISDCIHQNHIFAVRPNRDILLPEYLSYLIQSGFGKAYFLSVAHRTTNLASINSTKLKAFPTLIPPLAEQRAIAHTLLTIQKAKEARQRELQLERERKAALMQYLFTHGTRNEPRKKTELGDIPESWQVVRLDSIAEMASGGTPSKNRLDWWKGEIPWVSTKDLKQPRLWDTQDHISEEGLQNGSRLVPAKTLFVAVRGMCLTKDIPVAMAEVPMAFNQDIKAMMPLSSVDAEYLLYTFQYQKADILQFVGTSAHGTKRLGTSSLQVLPILLPPIEEQQLISEALRACDRKITALEQEAAFLDELFRAMLEELMTGGLSALPLVEEKAIA